ncbi:hypothetical protein [Arthrobacter sp. HY1533]|uniref:hypothetical protein n=1 Tax=Arthrobacter sp. HY1533 TaxID=2970919 RepID=UPI0022BA066C|nr:hypothetical protein [Arthrobacter sp. HY1533]
MTVREWAGTEWQDFCIELLRIRYDNHNLVEVPDRHNGDLGLEAFTHDGVAFQCYAAQEPLSTATLYEHQRDKLTTDLSKLRKNQSKLERMFNQTEIRRYVFLVHRHDSKELVIHAQTKATEVRTWGLSFIGADFAITVETDDNYAQERDRMSSIPAQMVQTAPVDHQVLSDWELVNPDLLQDGRRKLTNIGMRGSHLDNYLAQLSGMYLRGENALADLRAKYPSAWSAISKLKTDKESMLSLAYPPDSMTSGAQVSQVAIELAREIARDGGIPDRLATEFSWCMIADWILRCPLDFPESA